MRSSVRRMPDFPEEDELRVVLQAYMAGGLDLDTAAERIVALTYGTGWSFFAMDNSERPDEVARAQALAARVEGLVIERLRQEGHLGPPDRGTA